MIKSIRCISLIVALTASYAQALSPAGENQIKALTLGGPSSIKNTAESIFRVGSAEVEVSDTLAEIVLQNYTNGDRQYIDAVAWSAKALGKTGNARYRSTLTEVLEKSGNKKLNKHVAGALKMLPETSADQYVKGTVNLQAKREEAAAAIPAPTNTTGTGTLNKITAAVPGMSMEEVYALCGTPTATTSHITGKQFRPFNFKGGDDVRTYALYKGQGKIVFNQESRYTTTWKVLEVIIDPNETGYP
jgi:hypothetical protein